MVTLSSRSAEASRVTVLWMSFMSTLEEPAKYRLQGSPVSSVLRSGLHLTSFQGSPWKLPLLFTVVLEAWWLDGRAGLFQEPPQVHIQPQYLTKLCLKHCS